MSITLVYGTTTVNLTDERVPDSSLGIKPITVAGVRRTYLGAAKTYFRYRKHTVTMEWTDVTETTIGTLRSLSLTGSAVYGTGFNSNVFGGTCVNFHVSRDSWVVADAGLNNFNASLTFEEI